MSDQEWMAYLDTLPPEQRDMAQRILERLTTILERDRSHQLDDIQKIERRLSDRERAVNE